MLANIYFSDPDFVIRTIVWKFFYRSYSRPISSPMLQTVYGFVEYQATKKYPIWSKSKSKSWLNLIV